MHERPAPREARRAEDRGTLALEALGFRYGRAEDAALRDVSAALGSGAVAVLGPNGAGKSTLFSLLATTRRPTGGQFWFSGEEISGSASVETYRRRLGVLPQRFAAQPGYTCSEFLAYVAWLRRVPSSEVSDAVDSVLEMVDLAEQRDRRIKTLSGGMRQRLGLAQALVARPSVLLLDEPTVGLDPDQRGQFLRLLSERVIPSGAFTIMATHLVEDVAAFAHEVILLKEGTTVFVGTLNGFCGVPERAGVTGALVERAYRRHMGIASR